MEGKIMNVYEKLMTVQTKLRTPKGQYIVSVSTLIVAVKTS